MQNKGITLSLIYLCDLSPLKVTRAKKTAKILHSPERSMDLLERFSGKAKILDAPKAI